MGMQQGQALPRAWDSGVYELDAPRAYWSMDALWSMALSVS